MRNLWKQKLSWDDPLTGKISKKWLKFLENLPDVSLIKLPRCISISSSSLIELHEFGDATAKAYAVVIYIRIINGNSVETWLLSSKTRVAPVKTRSIPQLELCASLLTDRLLLRIKNKLKLDTVKTYIWSDSTTVLTWILDPVPGRWPLFVANRASEIQRISSSTWRYVKTDENPAYIASRGTFPSLLVNNNLW